MAFGLVHKIEFRSTSLNGLRAAFILADGLSGGTEKDSPQNRPLVLKVESTDETLESVIRGTTAIISMFSDTNYQYIDLFTASGRKYKVQVTFTGTYIFTGWLTPELYSEPHQPIEYPVSVEATDGLGTLKKFDWKDPVTDINYTGKQEVLQTILDILNRLDTGLQVYDSSYIYETHHNSTIATHSPLKQTYFDASVFIDDGEPLNCYEVLEKICERFHLMIRHYGNYYHIIQINAQKVDGGYTRRLYNLDGTFVSSAVYNPVINVTDSNEPIATMLSWCDNWANNNFEAAWKRLIIKQDFGLDDNLLNDDFYYGGLYPNYGEVYEGYNLNSGILYMRGFRGIYDYNGKFIYSYLGNIKSVEGQYLDIKLEILRVASLLAKIILYVTDGTDVYYLNDDSEWSKNVEKTLWDSIEQDAGSFVITSQQIPIDGSLFMQYHVHSTQARLTTPATFQVDIKNSEILLTMPDYGSFPESLELATIIDDTNNFIGELETELGDLPDFENNNLVYEGGLYYLSGGSYIPTEQWFKSTGSSLGAVGTLNDIIADEICSNHTRPSIRREGTLLGVLNSTNIIHEDGVYFMVISDEYDMGEDVHSISLLQLEGSLTDGSFLKLKSGGYLILKGGGKIKLKGRN